MYKNKLSLLLFALLTFVQLSTSQNNTNSPYTRFGYGDLSDSYSGERRALGGTSIGVRSNTGINSVNPASYSAVDSMTFMFDIGVSALGSRFADQSKNSNSTFNSNLEYISMQFPITKWLGFSAGAQPYSFVGYNFTTRDSIKSTTNEYIPYSMNFVGAGGFSQVYSGLSVNLFNHISIGANGYYMYGMVNNSRGVNFDNTTDYTSSSLLSSLKASNFRYRVGAQIYNTFAAKHDLTLGFIYEQKAKLNAEYNELRYGVLFTESTSGYEFETPTIFGLGLNYAFDKKLSLAFDYSLQQWNETKFYSVTDTLQNRSKINVGGEYIPNPKGRKLAERMRYRLGFNLSDSYFNINENDKPAKNFGISFGFGIPLRNSKTIINTSFEYGKVSTSNLLNEDFFKITFNAAFNEYWFFKRKL